MRKNTTKGFTLVELMAVLVILGILATVVIVNVSPVFQRANFEKIRADMANINKALEIYRFNELSYPTTSQGLDALVKPHSELKNPLLYPEGGYISSIPEDPWGRQYIYEHPSRRSLKYDLYTLGADGIEGGTGEDADVGNWMQ
ncbi:MAG: type II secretion system major pseudopilin GspG [Gammaproteobacteria bacterium]|jgi:general secretion pathway protein G|nr:MAG: type II secretion system protein GspG [Candidatus Pelagibacter sp. TMED128]|tara:strand:- start:4429 stop:4860 length:432 start_codon:yes stop_codon:yes gene_type:complete